MVLCYKWDGVMTQHLDNRLIGYPNLSQPFLFISQIYVTTTMVRQFSLTNFLFIISHLSRLSYTKSVGKSI